MGRIVIACYRPKAGKTAALVELTRGHVPKLQELGLATSRPAVVMQAGDGTVVEVFEWESEAAIEKAHSDPAVQELWAQYDELCEFVPIAKLVEASNLFSEFAPVTGDSNTT